MSADWAHQFCLACDKQTDEAVYCSESCRLADYEKTSSAPSSEASSPSLSGPAKEWSFSKPTASASSKFYLSPAFDFNQHSSGTRIIYNYMPESLPPSRQTLSPSTSCTSLCSMRTTSSTSTETSQVSDKATQELRAYARSFDAVRMQRRRSY